MADIKEDPLLQDDADDPNPDGPPDSLYIAQLTAVVSDWTRNSGANTNAANNMASASHSDSESQGHNNIVESLTQAYLPNTKISPAIEEKNAALIDNMLAGPTRSKRAPANIHHWRMSSFLRSQVSSEEV